MIMIEDYSKEIQDFIKNIGLYVFTKYFNNLSESEILQKCSNNSVEDIVQNYEEQLTYLKFTNSETIQEMKNNNQNDRTDELIPFRFKLPALQFN